jgi:hypothetical protein
VIITGIGLFICKYNNQEIIIYNFSYQIIDGLENPSINKFELDDGSEWTLSKCLTHC